MTENVGIAVIGAKLEEHVVGTVPLIDDFLYYIMAGAKLKSNRALVPLRARVALYGYFHQVTLLRTGTQPDSVAREHEDALAQMMDRPRIFVRRIDPCLDDFENK